MKTLRIAFDIDDTLILPAIATGLSTDTPNYEVIEIYKFFQKQGHTMIIWSGGGKDYARVWAKKLGLDPNAILEKNKEGNAIDICFDDSDVDLATVNVKIKRINNSVDRRHDTRPKIESFIKKLNKTI